MRAPDAERSEGLHDEETSQAASSGRARSRRHSPQATPIRSAKKSRERFAFLADTHEERLRLWTKGLLIANTPSLTLKAEARVLTEAVAY